MWTLLPGCSLHMSLVPEIREKVGPAAPSETACGCKVHSYFVCLFVFGLRILVPRPGIKPVTPAVEARSPNH